MKQKKQKTKYNNYDSHYGNGNFRNGYFYVYKEVRTLKIKKVDDKPMVIHTKEKAKIHSHEPKGARIKGSNRAGGRRAGGIAGSISCI